VCRWLSNIFAAEMFGVSYFPSGRLDCCWKFHCTSGCLQREEISVEFCRRLVYNHEWFRYVQWRCVSWSSYVISRHIQSQVSAQRPQQFHVRNCVCIVSRNYPRPFVHFWIVFTSHSTIDIKTQASSPLWVIPQRHKKQPRQRHGGQYLLIICCLPRQKKIK
jgi:hypothetical protein